VAANDIIARLGGWEACEVEEGWEEQRGSERWCVIRLRPVAGASRNCSGCDVAYALIHDCEERRVRGPLREAPVSFVSANSNGRFATRVAVRVEPSR